MVFSVMLFHVLPGLASKVAVPASDADLYAEAIKLVVNSRIQHRWPGCDLQTMTGSIEEGSVNFYVGICMLASQMMGDLLFHTCVTAGLTYKTGKLGVDNKSKAFKICVSLQLQMMMVSGVIIVFLINDICDANLCWPVARWFGGMSITLAL